MSHNQSSVNFITWHKTPYEYKITWCNGKGDKYYSKRLVFTYETTRRHVPQARNVRTAAMRTLKCHIT